MPADTDIRGKVTIKSGTIVHPRAKMDASLGPITVGENCIIEENVQLVSGPSGMMIGDGNMFRVGCRVSAPMIGNCNVFEARSKVFRSVCVSNFCVIGAACTIGANTDELESLTERAVIWGSASSMRVWGGDGAGQQLAMHAKQQQYLREQLPKHHKLRVIH